jgi:hypothetical protein
MGKIDQETLVLFSEKYIWWKTKEEAVQKPLRVFAQVMEMGDYEDVQLLAIRLGDDILREVVNHAEIGWFTERSWIYWHYRLGLNLPSGQLPDMPRRCVE